MFLGETMRTWIISILVFWIMNPTPASAQVARPHLMSKGNLTIGVGNPSSIDKGTARVYGEYDVATGSADYLGSAKLDEDASSFLVATDVKADATVISAAFESDTLSSKISIDNAKAQVDTESTVLAVQAAMKAFGSWVVGARLLLVSSSLQIDVDDSVGGATHNYADVSLGLSVPMTERSYFGVSLSPPVASNENFSGEFNSVTTRRGHGLTVQLGVGLAIVNNFVIGLDFLTRDENVNAGSKQTNQVTISGEWLFPGTLSIEGDFSAYQEEAIKEGSTFLSPPADGTAGTISLFLNLDDSRDLILGMSLHKFSAAYSKFGDATADETRLDFVEGTTITFSISGQF
jgi:hypothetical protein